MSPFSFKSKLCVKIIVMGEDSICDFRLIAGGWCVFLGLLQFLANALDFIVVTIGSLIYCLLLLVMGCSYATGWLVTQVSEKSHVNSRYRASHPWAV